MQNKSIEKLQLPGSWIDHPDRDWAFLVQMFLDEILDQLNEARLVLMLFEGIVGSASQVNIRGNRIHLIWADEKWLNSGSFVVADVYHFCSSLGKCLRYQYLNIQAE